LSRQNLKTFAPPKLDKLQTKRVDKEQKELVDTLRKAVIYSKKTNTPVGELGQLNPLPQAIIKDDLPRSGTNSNASDVYKGRYNKASGIFAENLSNSQNIECYIMDAMFLVYKNPTGQEQNFEDYGNNSCNKILVPILMKGFLRYISFLMIHT
jgi:hypothetical protein